MMQLYKLLTDTSKNHLTDFILIVKIIFLYNNNKKKFI